MGLFSFVGDVLGVKASRDIAEDNRTLAREQAAQNEALQREFAQHGIRWRVEDAKAAGIHPVFAMSSGGAAYSPSSVTVGGDSGVGEAMSRMGQNLDRAVASQETVEQRRSRELAEDELRSRVQRNRAEADMFNSITVKNYNQVPPSFPSMTNDPNVLASSGQLGAAGDSAAGRVEVKPSEVTSYAPDAPWLAAGKSVMFKKYKLSGNREWLLPDAGSASEALESVSESWPLTWMVLKENLAENPYFFAENKHLLPDWLVSAGEFLGQGAGALENAVRKFRESGGHGAQDWPIRGRIPNVDGRLPRGRR